MKSANTGSRKCFGLGGLAARLRVLICAAALLCLPSPILAASDQSVVHQVEFEGVTILSEADVTELIEVAVGERLDKDKVLRTANALRDVYIQRGYQDAKITVKLRRQQLEGGRNENVLNFTVSEGTPTRILNIELEIGKSRDDLPQAVYSIVERVENEMVAAQRDKILGQEKVGEISRLIEEGLTARGLLGGGVGHPDIYRADPPKGTEPASWISMKFVVDPGELVSFGFRGNQRLSKGTLMGLIDELRVVGLGRDYIDVIQNRILQEYRKLGFATVAITPRAFAGGFEGGCPGKDRGNQEGLTFTSRLVSPGAEFRCGSDKAVARHLTYVIDEGPRYRVRSVTFDGNSIFSEDELRGRFEEVAPQLLRQKIYVEEEVEKAVELVAEWMKSRGYLSAKSLTINRNKVRGQDAFDLVIYLYEGEQTLVREIRYQGNELFRNEEISGILGIESGAPLNLFAFSEGLESLKSSYRKRGYLDVVILNEGDDSVVRYFQKNRFADVFLTINEGYEFKTSRVEINGLSKTGRHVVARELLFREGEVIDEDKLARTEAKLRKLGIFSTIRIQHRSDPERLGHKLVRVDLQEATPGLVAGGVGFRNDLGLRVFGEIGYGNVAGENHSWSLNANANRRVEDFRYLEYQARLGYVWPWFFGVEGLVFRPEAVFERRQYINFDAETLLFNAVWEKPLVEQWNLTGSLGYSIENTKQSGAVFGGDNTTLLIGSVTPGLTLDLRDDPLSPRSGFYSSASFEIADRIFGSQLKPFPIAFTRFQFRADYFLPLSTAMTWYFSFRTGYERNTANPFNSDGSTNPKVGIPLIKQFALGGVSSLRGYKLQELNVQGSVIQGTASFVNYRTQIDIPVAGDLKLGPFLDAAVVNTDIYSLGNLRYGVGLGLHYQTPVGPVNFDLGFKIAPRPGEDRSRFHFSVGVL